MKALDDLGLTTDWLYETIVTTRAKGEPHAACMGVVVRDKATCELNIFKTSKTLANLLKQGKFAVNITDDLEIFDQVLRCDPCLEYERTKTFTGFSLKKAGLVIELELMRSLDQKNRMLIMARPLRITINQEVKPLNRASNLVLESLILKTRVGIAPKEKIIRRFKENHRVIAKVAPGSRYEDISSDLLKSLDINLP